ncbi:hypothetical protein [Promicromonospora sp. NPDC023805]|uniref:hypothetical protein n=1 Tax=Promicromonospora sp. NPDC023805 TaxID=3154696 RepID=UPI0033F35858
MTAPTVTGDFRAAGVVRQVVALHAAQQAGSVDAKLDAKLDATLDPKTMPEPDVLRLALGILVTYGLFTEEQAQTMLNVLTGGTFVNLPSLPAPEGVPLMLPMYDIFRGAINARANTVDSGVGDVLVEIGHFLLEVIPLVPDIVHGIEEAGAAIVGFFSGLFS